MKAAAAASTLSHRVPSLIPFVLFTNVHKYKEGMSKCETKPKICFISVQIIEFANGQWMSADRLYQKQFEDWNWFGEHEMDYRVFSMIWTNRSEYISLTVSQL